MVLASCEKGEKSWTLGSQSVFTKYLLEALDGEAGGDSGEVTLFALAEHVGRAVVQWAQRQVPPRKQTPTFYGMIHAQGFVLVPAKGARRISPLRFSRLWRPDVLLRALIPSFLGGYFRYSPGNAAFPSSNPFRPLVRVRILGEQAGQFLDADAVLDSAAEASVIPGYMIQLLGYGESAVAERIMMETVTGDQSTVPVYDVSIQIANEVISERMFAMDHLQDPILGLSLLRRFQIVLDFPREQVLLRRCR